MIAFHELVDKYKKSFEEAKRLLKVEGIKLSESDIFNYLLESPDIDERDNLIVKQIPAKDIALIVSCQYRLSPPPEVVLEIELPEGILPSGISTFLTHQQVKVKGEIWQIHKNDVDPFPSNPHAHNYQSNVVVHLGNGMIYRKRKYLGEQLTKKNLSLLRREIKNMELPECTR
jgi:hypothetical protein